MMIMLIKVILIHSKENKLILYFSKSWIFQVQGIVNEEEEKGEKSSKSFKKDP